MSGETIVDQGNIRGFLDQLQYPLYFLDYETVNQAIPPFDGTKPYQQIPFQFSVHIQEEPGAELTHHEYLHKEQSDPRRTFAEQLVELCGQEGSVIVYSQAFEIARNKELAAGFPEYAVAIEAINARIIDLLVPFKKRWLYSPEQKSSASIKAVLPAFTNLSYDDLEIANGSEAMLQYGSFLKGELANEGLPALWDGLTEYCRQSAALSADSISSCPSCLKHLCHPQTPKNFQGGFQRNAGFLLFEGIHRRAAYATKDG